MELKSVLVKSTVVAVLGGPLFGSDTAVISGTTDALRDQRSTFMDRTNSGEAVLHICRWKSIWTNERE